jgi:alpha-glucosidase (family GH31 glycosyl hydrolase)
MTDDGTGGGDSPANREMRDPELFLRWLQFGAVSPLFRTHCTHCEIRPWLYPNYPLLKESYLLRSALHPYVYVALAICTLPLLF